MENKTLPISIIIPTFFEEKLLPRLLQSIQYQVFQPLEVIVSDANSTDRTREIARQFGAVVVEGGSCPVGRNNGAAIAKGEFLLFIDADTFLPKPTTLIEAFVQLQKSKADIASVIFRSDRKLSRHFSDFAPNIIYSGITVFRKIQSIIKKIVIEWGTFMFVRKTVFDHVGGFNEEYQVGEDSKFFKDVLRAGYAYSLLDVHVVTSGRRFEKPKNVGKAVTGAIATAIAVALGYKATSTLRKKLWGMYGDGQLGGKQYSEGSEVKNTRQ